MDRPSVTLFSIMCPSCHNHAATIALEGSPQYIRHQSRFTRLSGERVNCRGSWVAVPDRVAGKVNLIPVDGRHQSEEVLRRQTAHWLETVAQSLGCDEPDGVETT